MIQSMTAFGSGMAESTHGQLTVELRSVNSRYLDIHMRIPDEMRFLETALRNLISKQISRGKVDVRVSYHQHATTLIASLDNEYLQTMAQQLAAIRAIMPDVTAPSLMELLQTAATQSTAATDTELWTTLCDQACHQALQQLQQARQREGERLAQMMLEITSEAQSIADEAQQRLPAILEKHQEQITKRLHDSLRQLSPKGFAQISGEELTARIAQEASLFSMRSDIAEELDRLRSHIKEVQDLLNTPAQGSHGKRLDFLCQEMNREANTLGSKAAALDITNAAINLKLLIDQLREQAQNIE